MAVVCCWCNDVGLRRLLALAVCAYLGSATSFLRNSAGVGRYCVLLVPFSRDDGDLDVLLTSEYRSDDLGFEDGRSSYYIMGCYSFEDTRKWGRSCNSSVRGSTG